MKAKKGDWLVIKNATLRQRSMRGLIIDVRSPDGTPPYVVRWLDTGDEATVVPPPNAIIVTAAEQKAADERARSRLSAMQTSITHHTPSE